MIGTLILTEYKDQAITLADEDAEFIITSLSKKFSIRKELRDYELVYIINPNQWVGVVTLPSGRRLESRTKVPVRNLFYMLAVALELEFKSYKFWDETSKFERFDQIFEFIASYFAELVDTRIKQGLYRSYVEQEDNLFTVRGRIEFAQDSRYNYALRHRTYCRFTEFTWDIPENQIIRQVTHLLSRWDFRKELRFRLNQLDGSLAEVSPVYLPAGITDKFYYNRQNSDYKPLHSLCRLFLEGSSLHEDIGSHEFRTFVIDMNKLFEAFVTQLLKNRAASPLTIHAQKDIYLDTKNLVNMQPDIVITNRGKPILIADCKYKVITSDEYKNHDLYQLLSYCTVMGVERGFLIYPLNEVVRQEEIKVRQTSVAIRHKTIDLNQEGEGFVQECNSFTDNMLVWAS